MSMIYQDNSSFGKQIPIYSRYKVLEDSTKCVNTASAIYAGRPVKLATATGNIEAYYCATDNAANVKPFGLAKFQYNCYLDEVLGSKPAGVYGSGRGNVVVKGVVDVGPNYFTDTSGSVTTVVNYLDESYLPGDALYVATNCGANQGALTAVVETCSACPGYNSGTFTGYVLNYDVCNATLQVLLP
jgi:hypothetical protein